MKKRLSENEIEIVDEFGKPADWLTTTGVHLRIKLKSEFEGSIIKEQILENQAFVSKYHKELKELQKTSNNSLSLAECDRIIKQQWSNEQDAKKLATIEKNLNAVIRMLEKSQEKKFDAHIELTLSYLYDIRDNKIPQYILDDMGDKV